MARFIEQRVPTTLATGCSLEIKLKTIETEGRTSVGEGEAVCVRFVVGVSAEAC